MICHLHLPLNHGDASHTSARDQSPPFSPFSYCYQLNLDHAPSPSLHTFHQQPRPHPEPYLECIEYPGPQQTTADQLMSPGGILVTSTPSISPIPPPLTP